MLLTRQMLAFDSVDMATCLALSVLLLIFVTNASGCRHLDHVTKCFKPVLQSSEHVLERNEMIILSGDVKQVWTLCKQYFTGQGCLQENLRRCGGLGHVDRQNLEIYVESVVKRGVIRLCEDPSFIHQFAIYSDCFFDTKNETGACLHESRRQFRSEGGSLRGASLDELSRRHCGTVERLLTCGYKSISRSCGHTPGVLYLEIMQRFLPKRAVDVCIGPYVRLRHGANGYSHLTAFTMTSTATKARPGLKQLYLGLISVTIGLATVLLALICLVVDV